MAYPQHLYTAALDADQGGAMSVLPPSLMSWFNRMIDELQLCDDTAFKREMLGDKFQERANNGALTYGDMQAALSKLVVMTDQARCIVNNIEPTMYPDIVDTMEVGETTALVPNRPPFMLRDTTTYVRERFFTSLPLTQEHCVMYQTKHAQESIRHQIAEISAHNPRDPRLAEKEAEKMELTGKLLELQALAVEIDIQRITAKLEPGSDTAGELTEQLNKSHETLDKLRAKSERHRNKMLR